MKLFNVYDVFNIRLHYANGSYVYDQENQAYLDFYGGHAVISIGHNHPYFVRQLEQQLREIMFYSNSVINDKQEILAEKLGEASGLNNYQLFLCNSGAEANENALKLASFYNGRKNIIALKNSFHGRTSAAVNVTDNPSIQAPINQTFPVTYCDINDLAAIEQAINDSEICAVILEVVQGVGGLHVCRPHYLQQIQKLCTKTDTVFIVDEVQAGYGRTGRFFAFQHAGIQPDIITMAKGMGNGFPIGGVLISDKKFEAKSGLLGTTFGGNYLACQAALAVLEVIEAEGLVEQAQKMSEILHESLADIPSVKEIRGLGLMTGCRFDFPIKDLRQNLLYKQKVFTGSSKDPNLLRLLPPLSVGEKEILCFIDRLKLSLSELGYA